MTSRTTRRDLLRLIATTTGYAGMGLGPANASLVHPADKPLPGHGARVAVLGAGIAGLVAAYELMNAGYDVVVLEARDRVGGRVWTLRRGDKITYADGVSQVVNFDAGQYFDAGASRLPSTHATVVGYCRDLGVKLEVEINDCHSAFYAAPHGGPVQLRRILNDSHGHMAALVGRCLKEGYLDAHLTLQQKAELPRFLKLYGDLQDDLTFKGTDRSGFEIWPDAERPGRPFAPLPIDDLLDEGLTRLFAAREYLPLQPTMLQPVGGMDQIAYAFHERLKENVKLGCEVTGLFKRPHGVQVIWRDTITQRVSANDFDYAVVTLPVPIIAALKTNLATEVLGAIRKIKCEAATKIAWQAPRFWEREANIFGGLSFVPNELRVISYPSHALCADTGILGAGYAAGDHGRAFGHRSLDEQFEMSRRAVEQLHPGHGADLASPVAVTWEKIPFSLAAWAEEPIPPDSLRILNAPDERVYFAGDYLSFIPAWQEGAALSARSAVAKIGERINGR